MRLRWPENGAGICLLPVLIAVGLAAGSCRGSRPEPVTLSSCLVSLTNLTVFAEKPAGRAAMISSHDPTGGNRDWKDISGVGADGRLVIADLKGPGCITRIWKTNPAGRWQFYFDGEEKPRIDVIENGFFGEAEPFLPPLCGKSSNGFYSYMPIPYAKSLKIVITILPEKRKSFYFYHVNYLTYPRFTRVESFPADLDSDTQVLLDQVRRVWSGDETDNGTADTYKDFDLPPGGKAVWLDHKEAGILRSFRFQVVPQGRASAHARAQLLREVVLRLYWDGESRPSVEVPLGDFFCNGLARRRFSSMPLSVSANEFVCRFPMPFRKAVRAELVNEGSTPILAKIHHQVDSPDEKPVYYFHARWNSATWTGVPYPVFSTRGEGQFVGCYLTALGMDGSWNILEGDETIWVDDETTPSWQGTGLEDYFNGAWYYTGLFELPLHGLLEKGAMRTSQYRFHLPDRVPFSRNIRMSFEFGADNQARGYMSSTAYWYQSKPESAGTVLPPVAERFPQFDPVAQATMMATLFELERIGLYEEAKERCLFYAERFGDSDPGMLLRLRAAAYDEEMGVAETRSVYAAFAGQRPGTPAGEQAARLLALHDSGNQALLGAHINGRYVLYLDGVKIGEGDDPINLSVFPVVLAPGEHELCVEVVPTRYAAWISVALKRRGFHLTTDMTWEYVRKKPAGWPHPEKNGAGWKPAEGSVFMLPIMAFWQFYPNAYVNMQSGAQCLVPWVGWDAQPSNDPVYLRKRFIVPDA